MIQVFTKADYQGYCDRLAAVDRKIKNIVNRFGYPVFWQRTGEFEGLVRIILEQQVSLVSALAVYRKLKSIIDPITPESLIRLKERDFKFCGFSRQKTLYVKILANEILNNHLNMNELSTLPDDIVRQKLIAIKGIGNWTCDIYLLICLNRLDIFPLGDLALIKSMVENKFIHHKPSKTDIQKISEQYKPFRSIFSMIMWHTYIGEHNIKLD